MDGIPRLAGHRFLSKPSSNLEVIIPTRNMARRILQEIPGDYGGMTLRPSSNVITHEIAQAHQGRPIEVFGNPNVAMQDWDWPDVGHISKDAITISNLGDVYDSMQKFTTDNPGELWKMYMTPGGVRGFDMANNRGTGMARQLQQQLNSDPLYAKFSEGTGQWNVRVSPKAGREGDFVALPIGTLGDGIPLSGNMDYVRRYHDVPIMENRIVNEQQIIPESAFQLLERQAETLPSSARPLIDPLLSMLYRRNAA